MMMMMAEDPRPRRGRSSAFTLVELLVAIVIVSILAATALFTLWGVQEDAKQARTRSQVTKLHELLMERWESYRTRPVRLAASAGQPRAQMLARLLALRELMRMELPDRISDLRDPPVSGIARPSLWLAYRRRCLAVLGPHPTIPGDPDWNNWTAFHQGAECLYLIVANITDGDTSALDFFKESEIQDTDGDGMLEIVDGWERPIEFLRWAPGFLSDTTPAMSTMQTRDASVAPDPFDPLKVDPRWLSDNDPTNDPFALYPLVYSAGRDATYDTWPGAGGLRYATAANDPYIDDGSGRLIGSPYDSDADGALNTGDNITNHLTEVE